MNSSWTGTGRARAKSVMNITAPSDTDEHRSFGPEQRSA